MSDGSTRRLVLAAAASAAAGSLVTLAVLRLQHRARDRQQQAAEGALSKEEPPLAASGDPFDPSPRAGYLNWEDYFMAVAFLSAQRSKDPNKQVGACIVDRNNVICGIGYNGFPRGCSDSELPWAKKSRAGDPLETKYPYVCHAEMNAILNKNGASVAGAKVYVTMFPCNECAKLMIQAGISEIVYHEAKGHAARSDSPITATFNRDQQYAASRRLLALAGVKLRQHSFRQPVVLRLTNNHKQPALVLSDSASSSRQGTEDGEAEEAGAAEVAPALSAALAAQNGGWADGGHVAANGGLDAGAEPAANGVGEHAGAAAGLAAKAAAGTASRRRRARRRVAKAAAAAEAAEAGTHGGQQQPQEPAVGAVYQYVAAAPYELAPGAYA